MNRLGLTTPSGVADNTLGLSWHDSAWIPILNSSNVIEYFSQLSNPFFDRTCNNEIVKMQRLNPDQLRNMNGIEYVLLHVQEPILYVIRKQHRHSPEQFTPLNEYYIIAGIVYQAPDLASVLNSRLLSAVHHVQGSFEEASGFSRYHPSKGYYWDFKSLKVTEKIKIPEKEKPKEESSSLFQRQRVDMLLGELIAKFPLPIPITPSLSSSSSQSNNNKSISNTLLNSSSSSSSAAIKNENCDRENGLHHHQESSKENKLMEIKQEKGVIGKPPPEKKPRLN